MNKKYIPRKMIPRSRFRDLYKEWDEGDRALLIDKMNVLLFENSQYTDSKNYGFLCNLLTSLAIVQVLESKGMPRKEAEQYTADAMYKFIEPQIKSMKKLASNGWFVRFLKLTMPMKFRNTLGYGWDVEFPKCGRDEFSMITHKCIFHQIFEKYGMPEMTAIFCKVDDILYSDLPRADFLYSQQIGNGGTMCDYKFRRKKLSA
jgi:hypothetical protein